jgi:hypothetical protein
MITDRAHYGSTWGPLSLARFVWIKWLDGPFRFCDCAMQLTLIALTIVIDGISESVMGLLKD